MEDSPSPAVPTTPVLRASDAPAPKLPTPSPTTQHGFPAASPGGSRASLSGSARFPAANPAEFVALVTAALGAVPQHELTDSEAIHRALSSHLSLDARRAAPLHPPSETLMSLADALSRRISALKASIDGDGAAPRTARPLVAAEPPNPSPTPTRHVQDSPSFSLSHDALDLCVRVPAPGRRVRVDTTPLHATLQFDASGVDSGAETPMESNCFSDDVPSGQLVPCSTQSSSTNGSPRCGSLSAQLAHFAAPRASQHVSAPHATPCRQSRTFVEELDCRGVPSPAELEAALQQIARNALAGRLIASEAGDLAGATATAEPLGSSAAAGDGGGPLAADFSAGAHGLDVQPSKGRHTKSVQDDDTQSAAASLGSDNEPSTERDRPLDPYRSAGAVPALKVEDGHSGTARAVGGWAPQSSLAHDSAAQGPSGGSSSTERAAWLHAAASIREPRARRLSCPAAARAPDSSTEWSVAKYAALRAVGRTRRWSIADSSLCAASERRRGRQPLWPRRPSPLPWPPRRSAERVVFYDALSEPAADTGVGEAACCVEPMVQSSPAVSALTDGAAAAAALFVQDGLIEREHVMEGWGAVEQHVVWVATGLHNMLCATKRVNSDARAALISSQAALFAATKRKAEAEASLTTQTLQTDAASRELQAAQLRVDELSAQIAGVQSAINLARNGVREARVTFRAKQEMVSQLQEEWSKQSAMRTSPAGTLAKTPLTCKAPAAALDDLLPSSTPTNKIPAGPAMPAAWAGSEPADVDPAVARLWDAPNVFAEYVAAPHNQAAGGEGTPLAASVQEDGRAP